MAYYNDNRRGERGRYGREEQDRDHERFSDRFRSSSDDDDENYWDDPDGYGIRARGYQSGTDEQRDQRYSRSGTAYSRDQGLRSTSTSDESYAGSYSGPGFTRERQQYGMRGSGRQEAGQGESGGFGYGSASSGYGGSSYGQGARRQYGGAQGSSYFTGQQRGWAQPSTFGNRQDSRFGSDYRSRGGDYSGEFGSGSAYGARESRNSDQDWGFLDRAGDEVASWFGDEEAARRREMDHRGRGPANYMRSDDRIREDANDRLTEDPLVDATHVTVSVQGGEITLDGQVRSRDAKRRAEDCVEDISGVRHVQNNLRVQGTTFASNPAIGAGSATGGSTGSFGAMSGATSPGATATGASTTGSAGGTTNGSSTMNKTGTASGGKATPAS